MSKGESHALYSTKFFLNFLYSPRLYDVKTPYFIVSFIIVLFEMVLISLYTAWINDASKEPSSELNAVPSATYNIEVSEREVHNTIRAYAEYVVCRYLVQ